MCLNEGLSQILSGKCLDFTDMVWGVLHLAPSSIPRYDVVLVDEAQDFSPLFHTVLDLITDADSTIVAVGDPQQSIMGFAGADPNSYANMIKRFSLESMLLPVSYRCPTEHIKLANTIHDNNVMQPRDDAPTGDIGKLDDLLDIKPGSLVICRYTQPLVSTCLKLLAAGKPAYVKGRDIGSTLIALAKKMQSSSQNDYALLEATAYEWLDAQSSKIPDSPGREQKTQGLQERVNCLLSVGSNCGSFEELVSKIDAIFQEIDHRNAITLATAHRCKGLEAENVCIIYPEYFLHSRPSDPSWAATQEKNVAFVALTRSKSNLQWYSNELSTIENNYNHLQALAPA
jgi:superfamily I DNA/RNA helicase